MSFTKQNFNLTPAVCVYDYGTNIKYVMKGIVIEFVIMTAVVTRIMIMIVTVIANVTMIEFGIVFV